jgi:hypothetical protein
MPRCTLTSHRTLHFSNPGSPHCTNRIKASKSMPHGKTKTEPVNASAYPSDLHGVTGCLGVAGLLGEAGRLGLADCLGSQGLSSKYCERGPPCLHRSLPSTFAHTAIFGIRLSRHRSTQHDASHVLQCPLDVSDSIAAFAVPPFPWISLCHGHSCLSFNTCYGSGCGVQSADVYGFSPEVTRCPLPLGGTEGHRPLRSQALRIICQRQRIDLKVARNRFQETEPLQRVAFSRLPRVPPVARCSGGTLMLPSHIGTKPSTS